MLPTCDHYSATYSAKQKKILGIGFTPPCKLKNNGEQHPALSGVCETFAWERWTQKMDQCVKLTTWENVPCGAAGDPTAGSIITGSNSQNPCKDKITAEMVDVNNPKRMYNHFTTGSTKSEATATIWDNMNAEWSPDRALDMNEVWKKDAKGVERLTLPTCFVPAPDGQVCVWNQKTEDV